MWTKEKYEELINSLFKKAKADYLEFTKKITNPGLIKMIGVKIPELRKIAKETAKTDFASYYSFYQGKYFEERMLLGMSIGYSDIDIYDKYLEIYAKEITDWSLCDSVASSLKLIKKNNEHFYPLVLKLIETNQEFIIRFGLVILLFHYMNDDYIDEILKICLTIQSDAYYVKMAVSWVLCECFIKYPSKTDKYISSQYLSSFILNKTISKICDSFRVSKETKEMLKKRRV